MSTSLAPSKLETHQLRSERLDFVGGAVSEALDDDATVCNHINDPCRCKPHSRCNISHV